MSEGNFLKSPLPLWERPALSGVEGARVRGHTATTHPESPHPDPLPLSGRGRKWTQREPWALLLIPLALFLLAVLPLSFALSSSAHAQDVSHRSAVVVAAEKASPAVVSIIDVRLSQSLLVSIGRGRQLYHVTIPLDQG